MHRNIEFGWMNNEHIEIDYIHIDILELCVLLWVIITWNIYEYGTILTTLVMMCQNSIFGWMYSILLILYRKAFETLMTRITMVTAAPDSQIWPVSKLWLWRMRAWLAMLCDDSFAKICLVDKIIISFVTKGFVDNMCKSVFSLTMNPYPSTQAT
jgi:hypothetical protein